MASPTSNDQPARRTVARNRGALTALTRASRYGQTRFALGSSRIGETNPLEIILKDDTRIIAFECVQVLDVHREVVLEVNDVHRNLQRVARVLAPLPKTPGRVPGVCPVNPSGSTDSRNARRRLILLVKLEPAIGLEPMTC